MTTPTIELRTITPEWAAAKLDQLTKAIDNGLLRQRHLSDALVQRISADILADHFITNHQPICLAGKDELVIDGQHRLWAVRKAAKPVQMFVSTGWPLPDANNGLTIMDTIDTGKARSTVNILQIRGLHNATAQSACATSIAKIFCGRASVALSPSQVIAILSYYRTALDELAGVAQNLKLMPSYLAGPLSIYMKAYPRKGRALAQDFFFMENLKPGHPVLLWHKFVKVNPKARSGSQSVTYQNILRVCNAIKFYDAEEEMAVYQPSDGAREWLIAQDKPARSQMKEILGT